MKLTKTTLAVILLVLSATEVAQAQEGFAVHPYIQRSRQDRYVVKWYTRVDEPGEFQYSTPYFDFIIASIPEEKPQLRYSDWEILQFGDELDTRPFYEHRIELERSGGVTPYTVNQSGSSYTDTIRLLHETPITRFIVFGDSEVEPESSGKYADWPDPSGRLANRKYLVDQTEGFTGNLDIIRKRKPHFLIIAGDLVASGGEQRDWDEFWRHMTHSNPDSSIGGSTVILASPGDHEYYHGPFTGGFDQPFSEQAIQKFQTYFEFPDNGSRDERLSDRYFSLFGDGWDIVSLDVTNGFRNGTASDTNFFLRGLGESQSQGGASPGFQPRTIQREWLKDQLRPGSRLKLVILHHVPYSSGPHGRPAGTGPFFDQQSGVPVRELMEEFVKVRTTAILAGHDEMYERSLVDISTPYPGAQIQVYDLGIGGDDLGDPVQELANPHQKFIAHRDSPEVYSGQELIDGGKHYGHLEIDYIRGLYGTHAVFRPIYAFPVVSNDTDTRFERRVYPDTLDLFISSGASSEKDLPAFAIESAIFPNPSQDHFTLSLKSPSFQKIDVKFLDILGRIITSDQMDLLPNQEIHKRFDVKQMGLARGNYFVQIIGSNKSEYLKFVAR